MNWLRTLTIRRGSTAETWARVNFTLGTTTLIASTGLRRSRISCLSQFETPGGDRPIERLANLRMEPTPDRDRARLILASTLPII